MKNRPSLNIVLSIGAAAAALLFGGCATPSTAPGMTAAAPLGLTVRHSDSLSVEVTGGTETSAMMASKIANSDFAAAIESSITQSGLFASISPSAQADYQLKVHIVRLEQPIFGASLTVTLEATWTLVQRSTLKTEWEKAVTSSYTASMGDSLVGVKRLRLANEGAARNNIQDAIRQMGALTLP